MTTTHRARWITYTAVGLLTLILLAIMGIMWGTRTANTTATAESKAQQLNQALVGAGLRTIDPDVLVNALGKDGGALCADPAGTVHRGADLYNGAAGPGQRPVIAPRNLLIGAELAIQVYCPKKQQEFTEAVEGLTVEG
ncbi:hypothetical protein OIE66_42720 [Nonomuraea sp. NBC_01738]|uniref:hypothetical protein n=1 Tax=Nonomuraea sp. NBC_01738 TaxID=2976003 RepID=UPI002E0E2D7B|nr:hypothetical protein OIE66_42720 [Nonomuraea sp. NBC_01738]